MTPKRPFYHFSPAQDETWRLLWARQWPQASRYACRLWREGLAQLGMHGEGMPDFAGLDKQLQALVGWELVSTPVQYSDGQDWFEHLAQRKFLITEYVRGRDSLEYTPLPDIWHDAFGHLPFMAHQDYADYLAQYGRYAIEFTPAERKAFGSMWWYTIEFGLIREEGDVKAFGAGLMSSYGEMYNALVGRTVELTPFSLDAFDAIDPSPHVMHTRLFVFDSMAQITAAMHAWVARRRAEKAAGD